MSEVRCKHNMLVDSCSECSSLKQVHYESYMSHFRDKDDDEILHHIKRVRKVVTYGTKETYVEKRTDELSKKLGIKCS